MSKYTRLANHSNSNNSSSNTIATTTTSTSVDDDDCYTLFIGHNHSNGNITTNNSSSNNNISLDALDDSTMEVPLLIANGGGSSNQHNNNNNDQDYDRQHSQNSHHQQQYHACRCDQAGFAANLTTKATQEAKVKIICAISLCGIFMIIEFLGGYLAGSLAIMTDAAHLASDCISFVIGLVAIWLGSKPPSRRMSFGYKRTEVMGAIISIFSIWILTATLVIVAIERILSNDYDLDANTMMTISGIGILINIVMAFILHGSSVVLPGGAHGHSHAHHGHAHTHGHGPTESALLDDDSDVIGNGAKQHNSVGVDEKNLNLRAAMIHVIGDLVQSVGVFLASILIKFFPAAKFVDPLCTLLFSVIVILTTVNLFKESVGILLDAVPKQVAIGQLEMDLASIEGVKSVHHLNVWNHTSGHSIMMVHLVIDFLSDSNTVLDRATTLARSTNYNIKHSTIQIERLTP